MANVWKLTFYIHGLLNYNYEFRILLMIKIFKTMNNLGGKSCDWHFFVREENSRVNVLHK